LFKNRISAATERRREIEAEPHLEPQKKTRCFIGERGGKECTYLHACLSLSRPARRKCWHQNYSCLERPLTYRSPKKCSSLQLDRTFQLNQQYMHPLLVGFHKYEHCNKMIPYKFQMGYYNGNKYNRGSPPLSLLPPHPTPTKPTARPTPNTPNRQKNPLW
jgi:hypothetical protein